MKLGGLVVLTTKINAVLNSTIHAINTVIPVETEISEPSIIVEPFEHASIGVLIGVTGDVLGRLFIEMDRNTVGRLGEFMFNMPLSDELLESFAAELGNMVAGNLSTHLSNQKIEMDITPPTVISGESLMYGFNKAFNLSFQLKDIGKLTLILMIENEPI